MKTKTYLPVFPGFYSTIFEPDNEEMELDHINEIREEKQLPEITFDNCQWDYKSYFQEVSKSAVNAIEKQLNDVFDTKDIEIVFEALISPREYNFGNDSINIEINIEKELILNYLKENMPEFTEHIKEKYTSCSGFISSHSNDAKDWINDIKNEVELDHKLGATLNFILLNEGYDTEQLYYDIERPIVQALNYDELIGEE